jgi:hypothetical protein
MRRRSQAARRARMVVVALSLALLAAMASSALGQGEAVHFGNLLVEIDGGVSPVRLPKTKPAPVTLKVSGSIATTDGSRVPALKTLDLQFDRHGTVYTKGLPTCASSRLRATTTAAAKRACKGALVGTGRASAEIYLPEQPPFGASGPMLIFNGVPKGGRPVVIIHVYAHVPAPTTFITSGTIAKGHGKYGTQTQIDVPTIVAGQGSLTGFEATIHRTWSYKGQKRSFLAADCPTGSLFAHGEFSFVEGTEISGKFRQSCG